MKLKMIRSANPRKVTKARLLDERCLLQAMDLK